MLIPVRGQLHAQDSLPGGRVGNTWFSVHRPEGDGWELASTGESHGIAFGHLAKAGVLGRLNLRTDRYILLKVLSDSLSDSRALLSPDSVASLFMNDELDTARAVEFTLPKQDGWEVLPDQRSTKDLGARHLNR